jgi:hypothetical protein
MAMVKIISVPPSDAETQIKIITKDTFNKYFSKFLKSIHQWPLGAFLSII